MSYFAIITWDDDSKTTGIVENYIVASSEVIASGNFGAVENIIEDVNRKGSKGDVYRSAENVFYSQAGPYPSWTLDEETWMWEPPIEMPPDGRVGWGHYKWNEEQQRWDQVDDEE